MKTVINPNDYNTWDKEIHRVTAYRFTKHSNERGIYTVYKPQMEVCWFYDGNNRTIRSSQKIEWLFIGDIEFDNELECLKFALQYRNEYNKDN